MSARRPVGTFYRVEHGVRMAVHVEPGGYMLISATGPYTDAYSVHDDATLVPAARASELRNALRRHARYVLADARRRGDA